MLTRSRESHSVSVKASQHLKTGKYTNMQSSHANILLSLALLQWDPPHLTFEVLGVGNLNLLGVMCETHPPFIKGLSLTPVNCRSLCQELGLSYPQK